MAAGIDVAIGMVFPHFAIRVGTHRVPELGHASVLLIEGKSGITKYFEYGRYPPSGDLGRVEARSVPNVSYTSGRPTTDSLKKCFQAIMRMVASGTGGGHGDTSISGVYCEQAGAFTSGMNYATGRFAQNSNPNRDPYHIVGRSCLNFMRDTMEAAGVWMPGAITGGLLGGLVPGVGPVAGAGVTNIPSAYARIMRLFHPSLDAAAQGGSLSIQGR